MSFSKAYLMNTQNNCCHHEDTINQVKFEHQIYKKVTLYVDVYFSGKKTYREHTRQVEIYSVYFPLIGSVY